MKNYLINSEPLNEVPTVKMTMVLLLASVALFGCADSAQAKRNKFDACVIREVSGYWEIQTVREYENKTPKNCKGLDCVVAPKGDWDLVEKEVFVRSTPEEAQTSCVYLLE